MSFSRLLKRDLHSLLPLCNLAHKRERAEAASPRPSPATEREREAKEGSNVWKEASFMPGVESDRRRESHG